MDLTRRTYNRDLKVAAMREIDTGRTIAEVARQLQLSPTLLQRWRSEWMALGESAFPGGGRRQMPPTTAMTELRRIAELERQIYELKKNLSRSADIHQSELFKDGAAVKDSVDWPPYAKP
jgi:transposase